MLPPPLSGTFKKNKEKNKEEKKSTKKENKKEKAKKKDGTFVSLSEFLPSLLLPPPRLLPTPISP